VGKPLSPPPLPSPIVRDFDMSKKKDVVVFLETSGESAAEINKKLLAAGSKVAGLLGGNLSAMILGIQMKTFISLNNLVLRFYTA